MLYRENMKKPILEVMTFVMMMALCGCIDIRERHLIERQRGSVHTMHTTDGCDMDEVIKPRTTALAPAARLNSGIFSLLVWNVLKGMRTGWESDLQRFAGNKDLIILQEAYQTTPLLQLLQAKHYNWDLAVAFEYKKIKTGVLTASRIEPVFVCSFREIEPLIRIPKSILIAGYPMSGSNQLLLVANVHLINYTPSVTQFRTQLQKMEQILSKHQGPLIVCGDFNTWSDQRMAAVNAIAGRLNLKAVTFDKDNRSLVFGRHVDHVYYRELKLVEAVSAKVNTSDHNPLQVKFRVNR
jgi:endonuclease/exonuclease/phosphatase (EEP) superfamily protein YafD